MRSQKLREIKQNQERQKSSLSIAVKANPWKHADDYNG